MNQSKSNKSVDVMVIDNMESQARTLCQRVAEAGLNVAPLLLAITKEEAEKGVIPVKKLEHVVREIRSARPVLVLVDVCLHEQAIEETGPVEMKSATWTGPALMAEIRRRSPETRVASYSAYPADDLTDIEEQRKRHGVRDTPHFSVRNLTPDVIRALMGKGL